MEEKDEEYVSYMTKANNDKALQYVFYSSKVFRGLTEEMDGIALWGIEGSGPTLLF